ncbi:copper homeostasis periplasmic binding protein CopC [Massilia sp. TW-1]|uniref:Copper homeostasis periplasmic binding protein CopC n=1 Tax=Telluria antibiotica TaxID=2717319 RepID=A0ABX0P719_9BURK|nr:copper homeostasis periplasmic binding protein CopC [Telluria antibiotica]NIA53059.1 copper homeostasis periplasmic binding protein CopC [Telluria antibiotica]
MSIKRILAVATFALASGMTSSAFAHAKLQSSDPRTGSTLASAPKQVRLKFNEALEASFSKITLAGADNKDIPVTAVAVDKDDPSVMMAQLPALPAGEYRIQWSAMTHDSHKMKGEIPFTVK